MGLTEVSLDTLVPERFRELMSTALITGGFGGIGPVLAAHLLAQGVEAVVLLGRRLVEAEFDLADVGRTLGALFARRG